ncbi:AI-2E family transporter [Limibaculum sp. FT325]|uniref:AI-2E family transporter n=1 Tax=Thermohalobaculum sediminis TaxID=2939436 RepID=UPI0020BF1A2A|nr:AI-2E family transporter [Limibaculum sediminis]MCL5779112.1 AI-2E family transporter [Limibaculum sediminis]
MERNGRYLRGVVAVAATLWILIVARDVLIPFILALFIWFVVGAVSGLYKRALAKFGLSYPVLSNIAAAATIVLAVAGFALLLVSSATDLAAGLPRYEQRLDTILAGAAERVGLDVAIRISDLFAKIDLTQTFFGLAGSAAGAMTSLIVLIAYIVFIDQEAGAANSKLAALVAQPEKRAEITSLMQGILHEIELYMGVRVVMGLVQAVPTYIALALVGVDAPGFWAIMIFCASFVPTIGTLIGIVMPALMALVQFDTLGPFLMVVSILLPVQLLASNLLEPALLSRSMNVSPLAVFFGIFAGGALWGIVGALIVVPVLAICIIVFGRIPSMRPVAVLLSGDGRVETG